MAQADTGSMAYSSSSQGTGPGHAAAALDNPLSDFSMPSSGSSQYGDQNQQIVQFGSVPPMPMMTVGEADPLDNEIQAALAGTTTLAASSSNESSSLSNSTDTSWIACPRPSLFCAFGSLRPFESFRVASSINRYTV